MQCNGNAFSEEKHIIGGNSSLATTAKVKFTNILRTNFALKVLKYFCHKVQHRTMVITAYFM